ncbi:DHA2 family efflux MFS transporter permease subunit [Rhodobacter ferrooxidans]|uniref:Drug resistance transporter, EmrB/QacA subfamily n=1 Tax=Rhodobacter ferrooxidans TaxID=371731 RepID=C8S033_9RHOB|nr:DHA2 family efflux MFS transporter permease subunit [Rhodobacter sp. SW2]EEW25642.1 drug resistance transporter, EmrB/QacA subfamily [Rhodobacter sp. SW2]
MADAGFVEVPHRGLITLSIMLATIMQVLDTTIANVALPAMTSSLGASQDTITWVLTSYIVAAAIMTPVTGWLADRFGKREVFLYSIIGFVFTSMACGLAWSLPSMVAFRLFQGLFGAAIVPLSQTFLLDINPREKAGQAMAMWGAGIMVGPIIGPTLGGWLTEYYNWRWVFFINLPVGIVAVLGCWAYLPKAIKRPRRFDFFGFAMLSIAIGALQLMLDRGGEVDWFEATETWIYLFLVLSGFWVFTLHILQSDKPFLDPRMFADRNFVTGLIFIFVIGIILLASLALLPPMLARIYGYPTITTGLVMGPRGVGTMASMILVGRVMKYIDARALVVTGLLLTAWSLYLMTGFTPQMGQSLIIWSGVIQGLGLGLVFVPLSTVAFATIEPAFRADATSLFSLVRNIGSSIGISVVSVMLARNLQINHVELGALISPYNPNVQGLLSGTSLAQIDGLVNIQALMVAYIDDFKLMMLVSLAAIPLALLLQKPPAFGVAKASMALAD